MLYKGKNAVNKFIEASGEEINYWKKIIKKHFNILTYSVCRIWKKRFKSSNTCLICNKLFDVGDNKVRDHGHITGKYRGSAHWSCNINLKLTVKIPVIFHKLKGCDIH